MRYIITIILVVFLFQIAQVSAITLTGDKVRSEFEAHAQDNNRTEFSVPLSPQNDQDLVDFMKFLCIADPDIVEINLDKTISLIHWQQVKLFNRWPTRIAIRLEVDTEKLSYVRSAAWWSRFTDIQLQTVDDKVRQQLAKITIPSVDANASTQLLYKQKILLGLLQPWKQTYGGH